MAQPSFTQFAGTLVSSGSSPENRAPLFALEKGQQLAYSEIPGLIDNMLGTMTGIIINPTQVYNDAVTDLFIKGSAELGWGYEETGYGAGAPDKRSDGTCRQIGNVQLPTPVFHAKNYASHAVLEIFDKEFKANVMDPEMVATLVANKIRTIAKTEANKLALAEKQIMADICNGTRNITGYIDSSDPTSTAVYYPGNGQAATDTPVKGYCGSIEVADISGTVADVGVGSVPAFSTADAVGLLKQIKNTAFDMAIPSTDFNQAGREAFVEGGKPNLIITKKDLAALNASLMDGDQHKLGYSSNGATEFLKDAVEIKVIDNFATLPSNASLSVGSSTIDTDDYRIGCLLTDPSLFREIVYTQSMESERCMGRRSTIYDFQSERSIFGSTFLPSAAILFEKPSA